MSLVLIGQATLRKSLSLSHIRVCKMFLATPVPRLMCRGDIWSSSMAGRTSLGKDIRGLGGRCVEGLPSTKAQKRELIRLHQGDRDPRCGAQDGEEVGLVKCCRRALGDLRLLREDRVEEESGVWNKLESRGGEKWLQSGQIWEGDSYRVCSCSDSRGVTDEKGTQLLS